MRLVALIAACCFCLGYFVEPILGWRYHEKTRFDRSVDNVLKKKPNIIEEINKKPRVFTDIATQYAAYKDAHENVCYLKKLNNGFKQTNLWRDVIQANKNTLYTSDRSLTKIEAWRLAGGRVVNFCQGMRILALEDEQSDPLNFEDPFFNELPADENDIIQKRVSDVVLTPLKVRAKRQAIAEERERLNRKYEEDLMEMVERRKREATPYRGRFRGQTQSQYLNVGNEKEGKAEAEATQQSSRAVVSGSSGMGQAQSMSSGADGCDGCPGYDRIGSVPASIPGILTSQQGVPTGVKKDLDNSLV